MPVFQYKAKKQDTGTVEGQLIASTKEEAVERIHNLGLFPVAIEESISSQKRKGFSFRKKVTSRELHIFSRQLVSLLKSGITILRALEIVTIQTRNPYFQTIVENIRLGIKGGKSLSDCLSEHPNIFSSLYVTLVKAGEASGRLQESIADISEYLKSQSIISSKIRSALAYPVLMAVFGIGTIVYILTNVMPQITKMFVHLKQDLPWPTLFVMQISDTLVNYWIWILLVSIIIIGAITQWVKTKAGRKFRSTIKLAFPLIRDFWLRVELARFSRTLGLLLKSGVSIVSAIKISIPVANNELVQEELTKCQEDLLTGKSFGESLKRSELLPDIMGHLIAVGEESGSLTGTLNDISETYEQETDEVIKGLISSFEPIMIILVGSIIGFIVIAMLLPVFQMDIFAT